MAKKTGKTLVKMRQQMRAAKLARHKRELVEAGVDLSMPKPSAEARREKEEELKRLYLELFKEKKEQAKSEQAEEAGQIPEQQQGQQLGNKKQAEKKEPTEQHEQAEQPEKTQE